MPRTLVGDDGRHDTAQDAFKALMQTRIAPALRELGFRGSGSRFELPSESHWVVLGFQKAKWNTAERIEFTINVTVAEKDAWSRYCQRVCYVPERPSGNDYYVAANWLWQARIGELLPNTKDKWWTVTGSDDETVAAEVIEAIREHALPEMQRRVGGEG